MNHYSNGPKTALFIPTLNAGNMWYELLNSIQNQTIDIAKKLIIDSGSSDETIYIASKKQFEVRNIERKQFNHGGTRNLAVELLKDNDFLIFLTQDVILAKHDSLANLLKPFEDPSVACVYGRQIPHKDANPLARYAREYNYPKNSITKEKSLIPKIGFKVSHISNAFCAYRTSALIENGMFPTNVILAEDTYLASRFIINDLKIVYAANAIAYHSHNYSVIEEFKRYFDTGVFHSENEWIRRDFGQPDGEGMKYVQQELKYIFNNHPSWLGKSLISNLMKFIGFKLGQNHKKLPISFLKPLSMHKNYWDRK